MIFDRSRFLSCVVLCAFNLVVSGCASVEGHHALELTASMKQELLSQDVVLIGERHDNQQHHDFQGQVIDFLRSEGRLGNIYLEHLNEERAAALEKDPPNTPEGFARVTDWAASGWPDAELFSGLFESLLKGGTMKAVGIDRAVLMQLYQGNDPGLISLEARAAMKLDDPLPPAKHERLLQVLIDSHCGQINETHGALMLNLQRYRDAYMAARYEPVPGKVAVYLIGAGHSNKFYGVPHYLRQLHPDLQMLSIELAELGSQSRTDESDWALPTDKAEREDPCANVQIRQPGTA